MELQLMQLIEEDLEKARAEEEILLMKALYFKIIGNL